MTSLGNYTGPYVSDGKFQTSVEFGEAPALDELDALSRLHDSAYAKWEDRAHREAADQIHFEEASKLPGGKAKLAAGAVQYGNYGLRQADTLAQDVIAYGPTKGVLKFGIGNLSEMNARLEGTHGTKERKEVQAYFQTDPRLSGKDEFKGVGILTKEPGPLSLGARKKATVSKTPIGTETVKPDPAFVKVVDVRPSQPRQQPVSAPQRVMPQQSEEVPAEYMFTPVGPRRRKKPKRSRVLPSMELTTHRPQLARVADQATAKSEADALRLPEGAVLVNNGYDPTWNVNSNKQRRRKFKVKLPSIFGK